MSEPPGDRVQELFDQAVALPPEQRAAFLAAACADDPAHRAEVEGLLACDADFPDASRSRKKADTGSTTSPPGPTMRYGSWASPVATRRPARDTTSRDRSRPCSSSDSITPTS